VILERKHDPCGSQRGPGVPDERREIVGGRLVRLCVGDEAEQRRSALPAQVQVFRKVRVCQTAGAELDRDAGSVGCVCELLQALAAPPVHR
jgi:hypothetical protein